MIATRSELYAVLRLYNPWWGSASIPDLPPWRRAAFDELLGWVQQPPAHRAVLISGARQTGKTTLVLHAIEALLQAGVAPGAILYATFDHPLLKLLGLEGLLELWQEFEPRRGGVEYLFLDEIGYTKGWQTWLKHQVDFERRRRIVVTGSAVPLQTDSPESGVGRWHTLRLPTLSFVEYLQLRRLPVPALPPVDALADLFAWAPADFARAATEGRPLWAHFYQYLLRGGFPQAVLTESLTTAQKLLREDIVDKALKRDMTALFGVRRVLELEQTFLYLCMHDGGVLDIPTLCRELELKKPTVSSFIDVLEAAHLIYRLRPFGYGKEILRGRHKIYLADPAIAPSVMMLGAGLLEHESKLGAAVETAFFKHISTAAATRGVGFSYYRGPRGHEVDVVAEVAGRAVPFEVKHRERAGLGELLGLRELCRDRGLSRGYAITKNAEDFGVLEDGALRVLRIPAPLACYYLSRLSPDQPPF